MFGDRRGSNSYYYGSGAYKHINRMIKSAHEMHIVSPYIDIHYARFIVKRTPRTEFYIISSSIDENARKLLSAGKSRLALIRYAIASILLVCVAVLIGVHGYPLVLTFEPFLLGVRGYAMGSRNSRRIHLKVPRQFVHAKMYVSETQGITGSMNLTYKGTHVNVEHIDVTQDPDSIHRLRDEFWEMWEKY